MDTFVTKEAKPLFDKSLDRDHAPPNELEEYFNPAQTEQVYCTTQEREDYESDAEVAFTEDVISDQNDYDNFVRHLSEDCGLERV